MIIDNYQIWRIAIGDAYPEVKQDWLDRGYTINHSEATTPDTMPDFIQFDKKHRRIGPVADFTSVEKAIFYSHYALWEMVYNNNEPACIIEHDTVLIADLPKSIEVERNKCFCKSSHPDRFKVGKDGKPKTWYTNAAGYFLTPHGAELLMNHVTSKQVSMNVDGYIKILEDKDGYKWIKQYAVQKDTSVSGIHR